jgi:hypothetical protein
MKFAVSSVRFDDAAECLAHYELEKLGGVVRRGTWMSRRSPADPYHESVEASWVELDLDFAQLEELLAHVRPLAPTTRPRFRGILVDGPRHHEHGPGGRQWFRGPVLPAWYVTLCDSWMD